MSPCFHTPPRSPQSTKNRLKRGRGNNLTRRFSLIVEASIHSRWIDPIRRSTWPFCQGERDDVGRSRMPIAWMRRMNACGSRKFHPLGWQGEANQAIPDAMLAIVYLLGTYVANLFKSRRRLEAENLFLRHQLNIVLRRATATSAAAG